MEDDSLKIAVIGSRNLGNYGGVETACENLYTRLATMGFKVFAYCRSEDFSIQKLWHRGVEVLNFPVPPIPGISTFLHCFIAAIMATFSDVDIIHFHAQGPALFSIIPKLFSPNKKIVFTCHGKDWQRERWSNTAKKILKLGEKVSAQYTDFRIMVSADLKQHYKTTYGVNSLCLHNGVSLNPKQSLNNLSKQFGIEKGKYFLFVGRLVPEKAPHVLVQAFNRITTDYQLVIVGDSPETPEYTENLKHLAQDNTNIIFTGALRGSDIVEVYSNALAYVSSSHLEGNPITVLEAMSYGLPVLLSDIPPHQEILALYPDDRLSHFEINNIDACKQGLMDVIASSEERLGHIGQASQLVVEQNFNWDEIASKTKHAYWAAMNVHPDAPQRGMDSKALAGVAS